MRTLLMSLALLTVSLTSFAEINWVNYENAFRKAKEKNKLVMIYIYSTECHYCKEMDETTFKNKQIIKTVNENFIPVKVEKTTKEGKVVIRRFGYLGTPTFHFVEPNGKKLKSIFGAWKKEDFMKILKYFYEKHYKNKSMNEYFMEN